MTPIDLVVLPPSPGAPLGRIVGAGFGGLAYSDDDGQTWAPTQFYANGPAFSGWAAVRIEYGPHDGGHGGSVLALVEGNGGSSGFYRSADGLEWEGVSGFPGRSRYESRLLASPDGAVYLYETRTPPENVHRGQPVWRTTDGGATWESMGPVWEEWSAVPTEIAVGPDGRLWASAEGRDPDPTGRLGGVFRTVDPVVSVASEGEPPGTENLRLSIEPNPATGWTLAHWRQASAGAARVSVFDARGREVLVLADGPRPQGEQSAEVDTSSLAPGVYVVRVVTEAGAASARLVAAR